MRAQRLLKIFAALTHTLTHGHGVKTYFYTDFLLYFMIVNFCMCLHNHIFYIWFPVYLRKNVARGRHALLINNHSLSNRVVPRRWTRSAGNLCTVPSRFEPPLACTLSGWTLSIKLSAAFFYSLHLPHLSRTFSPIIHERCLCPPESRVGHWRRWLSWFPLDKSASVRWLLRHQRG